MIALRHRPGPLLGARRLARTFGLVAAAIVLAACTAQPDEGSRSSMSGGDGAALAGGAGATGASVDGPPVAPAEALGRYVLDYDEAFAIGYRIDWQYPTAGRPIKLVSIAGDSLLTVDDGNFLTRIRREDGGRIWRRSVADAIVEVYGVNFVPEDERVFVTTGGDMLVLDSDSGSPIDKHRLERATASTAPIHVGQFLIYGSRGGQVVWHSHRLDTDWAAYQVSQAIVVPPTYSDGYIVAVGIDGRIMCLRAATASMIWSRRALDAVVAPPVAGNGLAFVASRDQHLRGYDLGESRSPRWEYITESPLERAPVLIGDRVYQHVPTEGLVCLEAAPLDAPGGRVHWSAPEVTGDVVTRLRGDLIVWDRVSKQLALVDDKTGAVIEQWPMPQIDRFHTVDDEGGVLYAIGVAGRIMRLVPRN